MATFIRSGRGGSNSIARSLRTASGAVQISLSAARVAPFSKVSVTTAPLSPVSFFSPPSPYFTFVTGESNTTQSFTRSYRFDTNQWYQVVFRNFVSLYIQEKMRLFFPFRYISGVYGISSGTTFSRSSPSSSPAKSCMIDSNTFAPFVEWIHSAPRSSGGPSKESGGVALRRPPTRSEASRTTTFSFGSPIRRSEAAAVRPATPAPMMMIVPS
mmetsp:Transcript_30225/g.69288  ORF Transcript_30225/g.69288 Transcript_30225/m.69288 type:complete len:213 (+) Transcript_30225:753-1391(+)